MLGVATMLCRFNTTNFDVSPDQQMYRGGRDTGFGLESLVEECKIKHVLLSSLVWKLENCIRFRSKLT